jgi:hypothetical protein
MAYAATGTAGNDNLNQTGDTGPGTIVGLAGDDCIFTGSGLVTVSGDSGNDTVILQTGNTGTVNAGTENDIIADNGTAIGSMQLFGGDGADTIVAPVATGALTLVGGNDSNDGADLIAGGHADDILFGNGGNDTLADGPAAGRDTFVAGFGNDSVADPGGGSLVFGNQGNDSINTSGQNTSYGGLGNDCLVINDSNNLMFGNEGADTINTAIGGSGDTIVGGNDSADAGDSLIGTVDSTLVFGNGGADTLNVIGNADTFIGGQGGDLLFGNVSGLLAFGNEGNDTIGSVTTGTSTVFGGLGDDDLEFTAGRESVQGNEGNDTLAADLFGSISIDTISGGAGNDLFVYLTAGDDGNNATGGGPVEQITDLNRAEDRFWTGTTVTFAANLGAGTGATLAASANNAIAAALALSGSPATAWVAAQFTFGGRTYLTIDQAVRGTFVDTNDLLIDITGATGTITTSNFI